MIVNWEVGELANWWAVCSSVKERELDSGVRRGVGELASWRFSELVDW